MKASLSPAQACDLLNVSPSSLRRWSTVFAASLGASANPAPGRKRMYSADDIGVLQRAADLLRSGRSPEEVAGLLTVVAQPADLTGLEVTTLPTLARDLVEAREVVRTLAGELKANREEAGRLAEDLKSTRQDLQAAREAGAVTAARLEDTKATLTGLEARLKALEGQSWLDRLLGRKPRP